ncbi:MAG: hypothetical protein COT18_03270 [Elusimicrobia bacterium CG08_land_8_20_14_0_20_59_10]|nr:MAG: hypothetical protein COT18_03270 [Elusimicrobia bacterium CG08_land_8_20_14_0_20_59_10]
MNHKLRLKHPSGAEFEAEGPVDFILAEKEIFLRGLPAAPAGRQEQARPAQENAWNELTETRNGIVFLKEKHPQLKAAEAALLLLAAAAQLTGARNTSALALSSAIKTSGYMPGRLDRLLAKAAKDGLVRASGTKRNRAYRITDRGLERASLEAVKLV